MLRESVLLKVGLLFKCVSDGDTYEITYVNPSYGVAMSSGVTNYRTIRISCDNDGYFNGFGLLFFVDDFKPTKYVRKFKL